MAVAEIEDLSEQQEAALRRDWKLFTALTFLFMFGFTVYSGVFQNYLRDTFHSGPVGLGGLESTREVPGLLAALTTGILVALAESHVAALGLAITAIGIGVTGSMPNYAGLVGITVFWSIGFHLYATMSSAITLALGKGKEGGRHLGRMAGVGAVATILALLLSYAASKLIHGLSYSIYFVVAGAFILASAVLCWLLSSHAES